MQKFTVVSPETKFQLGSHCIGPFIWIVVDLVPGIGRFKDFSRTSKSLFNNFKDKKLMKNNEQSVKILLQKC